MVATLVRFVGVPVSFVLVAWGISVSSVASEQPRVFGWVEQAEILGWGALARVKMDTGALSSSMQASDIETFRRDHRNWVRFTVRLKDQRDHNRWAEHVFERPVRRYLRIVSSDGASERRPVVAMRLCLGGEAYEESFTLADRSKMIYPILLGRQTIGHLGLVDVTRKYTTSPRCGPDAPLHTIDSRRSDRDTDP